MAVSQTDIDALTAAIASGERQVTLGGKSVTYRSIAELKDARDTLQRELAQQQIAAGTRAAPSKVGYLYQSGRGFE